MSIEKIIKLIEEKIEIFERRIKKYSEHDGNVKAVLIGKHGTYEYVLNILKDEKVMPCKKCQALETKIEQMKTDHALEQLDRNMAKDRNDHWKSDWEDWDNM